MVIKPLINLMFSPTNKPVWSVFISFRSTFWSPFVKAILYESEFNRVIDHQVRLCQCYTKHTPKYLGKFTFFVTFTRLAKYKHS